MYAISLGRHILGYGLYPCMLAIECVCFRCKDELARGDVPKSAQCYMHETGASKEQVHAYVRQMICDTWGKMNYETKTARTSSLLSRGFVKAALNLARMSQCMYEYGDGHRCPNKAKTVEHVRALLVTPVPLDGLKYNELAFLSQSYFMQLVRDDGLTKL